MYMYMYIQLGLITVSNYTKSITEQYQTELHEYTVNPLCNQYLHVHVHVYVLSSLLCTLLHY